MNGCGTGWRTASTVTAPSSITSSSADWVFGDDRLISSATTTLANTAPGWNANSWVFWLKTVTPVMSEGSRSGVNWMRWLDAAIEPAIARASDVLPTPGTSSISRWPSANSATSARRTTSRLPCSARPTLSATAANPWANQAASLSSMVWSTSGLQGGRRVVSAGSRQRVVWSRHR